MNEIVFKPWIGENYKKGVKGKKILILGESHYGEKGAEYDNFTKEVVKEVGISKSIAYFTKIAKSILLLGSNESISHKQKEKFWHSVAFYNYVQCFVGEGPRERPTTEMWESSKKPFIEILNTLYPDIVVVFGCELWDNLPQPSKAVDIGATYIYELQNSHSIQAGFITHPSGGMSYTEAHARVCSLISGS